MTRKAEVEILKIPERPPDSRRAFVSASVAVRDRLLEEIGKGPAPGGQYRHWDTLRHIEPPEGLTSERWWAALKIARRSGYRRIPLQDAGGRPFQYSLADPVLERLHRIDRDASGQIVLSEHATNPATRDRYIVSSLIEEAITSSQLEGAATTRAVAKEMLRSGRRPTNKSERMIFNNYQAMEHIRNVIDRPLTREFVLELRNILTVNTLPTDQADLRQTGDNIRVYSHTGLLLHDPPPADQIEERMRLLCDFANQSDSEAFLHPVIKSIILHFWMAYDHPFTDGNGRTARALFYWHMLKQGFWLAEYISISSILRRAPSRYAKSFLYTETDDNDLTYFILSQLRVIEQAVEALKRYLRKKARELMEARSLLRPSEMLTHRQVALLGHALKHPGQTYTVQSHQRSHAVAYDTARTDLLDLEAKGLLVRKKVGKRYIFAAQSDLPRRLRVLGST